jgi:hypothetical protein
LYLLPLPALLLALSRYSYRAKELLVCWLFFCALFALLAVLFLGSVLACYAVHPHLNWKSVANTVMPELAGCLADIPQKAIPDPRTMTAGTLMLSTDTYKIADALDSDACLSIEILHSAGKEQNV